MNIVLILATIILTALAAHGQYRHRTWRKLYLHEQKLRTETQERLIESDQLLSDYAMALEKRDSALVIAQRRLNASRMTLMADTSRLTANS
ncbi:MAG: hypothetical protein AABY68_05985 [Pseudomonadota bacterium]